MNLTRLMVLGTLTSHGPQHGHQIRRTAEVTNVGEWGGVSVGALYRELKGMAGEGLVSELRTEQVGRRPARTVYAVTDQGRVELSMLREQAIRDLRPGPDPLGVALTFSGIGDDPEELASWMAARRDMLAVSLRAISAHRERLLAKRYITPLVATVMRRSELMIEGELRWHEEYSRTLTQVWAGPPAALTAGAENGAVEAGQARTGPAADDASPAIPGEPD
jgi:DNA-binding PadR family transcriptional regulator